MSAPEDLRRFVERALADVHGGSPEVAVFDAVRDMPYATDAAWDAAGLIAQGSGNCVAKAALLSQSLSALGHDTRIVRWSYSIADPFAELLPIDVDVHTAAQVRRPEGWVTIDATHDGALPAPPFVINAWVGRGDTALAYEPSSAMWVVGEDDGEIERAVGEIAARLAGIDTSEYARRFNAWLRDVRSPATTTN